MAQMLKSYTIKPGDTLARIADRFDLSPGQLLEVNQHITDPEGIMIGEVINIPSDETALDSVTESLTFDGITPAPGTTVMNRAQYTNPPLTNDAANRNVDTYNDAINQFAVGRNPRHLPTGGFTFCNIFMWDVTRAMNAEIPHWIDAQGRIAKPSAPGAFEININAGVDWLQKFGAANGWTKTTEQGAQDNANAGRPSVVVWKNPTGGHGHTAVIRPGSITADGPLIAQAGSRNFNIGRLKSGFGTRQGLKFYVHD